MMISHIDDDHINGILALLRDLDEHARPCAAAVPDCRFLVQQLRRSGREGGRPRSLFPQPAHAHNGNVKTAAVGAAMNFGDAVSHDDTPGARECRARAVRCATCSRRWRFRQTGPSAGKLVTTESIPHPPLAPPRDQRGRAVEEAQGRSEQEMGQGTGQNGAGEDRVVRGQLGREPLEPRGARRVRDRIRCC